MLEGQIVYPSRSKNEKKVLEMLKIQDVSAIKALSVLQADLMQGGVLYLISEGEVFTWRKPSLLFDPDIFRIGEQLNPSSVIGKAMREKRAYTQLVPRSLYGIRLKITVEPIFDDSGQAVGTFAIVMPRLHPIATSFSAFAPRLADMFSEGSFFYLTDLEKIAYRQASEKFDMPLLQIGYRLQSDDLPTDVIKQKKPMTRELDEEKFGIPVFVTSYPLFDEENPDTIVATFGIILPRVIAGNLRKMSVDLETGLSQIALTVEQLAKSASDIHTNGQALNDKIAEIHDLTRKIDELSLFIKKISEETNMLGLNAAIEAARAGESGRGFGVVAQEIRKLSEQSKSTVPQIKQITDRIKTAVEQTNEQSLSALQSSQSQAAATEEITASLEEITSMSEELNKIAKNL